MSDYREQKTVETLGNFKVVNQFSRNYLYYHDNKIAECVNGDYECRYGGIVGWLKYIESRSHKRISKINEQMVMLIDEREGLHSLCADILEVT